MEKRTPKTRDRHTALELLDAKQQRMGAIRILSHGKGRSSRRLNWAQENTNLPRQNLSRIRNTREALARNLEQHQENRKPPEIQRARRAHKVHGLSRQTIFFPVFF